VETGRRLRVLWTDNGGVFTSVEFESYCADCGVERQHTTPYMPQQNGVVEWRNQTVVAMVRSLLQDRGMPATFWGEAVVTAVYILNRAPTKAVDVMTPYEAWHGRRPDVHHFRTFSCVAFIKETKPNLKKLDDRGTPVIFIGYVPGAKAWHFYNPASRHAVVSRDAVFNEPAVWTWEDEVMGVAADFAIEYRTLEPEEDQYTFDLAPGNASPSLGPGTPAEGTLAQPPAAPAPSTPPPPESLPPAPEFVSPPQVSGCRGVSRC
jgi:hypothetical protein